MGMHHSASSLSTPIQSQSWNWDTELKIELRMKLMHGVNQTWSQSGMESIKHGVTDLYSPRNCQAIMGICVGGLGLLPP